MGNYCFTQYAAHGTLEAVQKLYNAINSACENNENSRWVGYVYMLLLGTLPKEGLCAGSFSPVSHIYVESHDDKYTLRFDVESEDEPLIEVMEEIAKACGLSFNWYSENTCDDIYMKHDTDGDFPQEFYVDDDQTGVTLYESLRQIVKAYKKRIKGFKVKGLNTQEKLSEYLNLNACNVTIQGIESV